MNIQQSVQPKSLANGFGRRRTEREGGMRLENKTQSGKSNKLSNAASGGKVGLRGNPSRDRIIYLTTCLIGHPVEVQLKNGSIYFGTCYTTNIEKEFAIILKMARLIKDFSSRGQKAEPVSKAPSKTLIIPGKDVVQVTAKDVAVTMDGISSELQHEKQQELMLDSVISQSRNVEMERELERWVPDDDDPQCPELENIFDSPWNRGWDQFEANEVLFGVKSTFDEELYTTKLEKGPRTRELEREAMKIAREIEGEETEDLHLAEERGMQLHENFDIDEETRFSSVYRGGRVNDSGCDEVEDILMDSRNNETFGDTYASSSTRSIDLSHEKSNDGARVLSSSSLDEAQCSQSSTGGALYPSGSYDLAASESRMPDSLHGEHRGEDSITERPEEQMKQVIVDSPSPKFEDSQPPLNSMKDGSEKGRLLSNVTASAAPSHVSSQSHGKTSLSSEPSEGAVAVKGVRGTQSVNSCAGPGSSTSSNSDCIGAVSASSGPGLSPSSSVGSLSSEKSTLNPHAKEFKLNPHAKSFTPSHAPVRPPSPVSDGSFYFPTAVSGLPHMHGMPMGIGIGPSFTGNQPVIYNPQVAPLQAPQAYYHPGGQQYGQQMLLGHPRQVFYMPSYRPEMPYKGREF